MNTDIRGLHKIENSFCNHSVEVVRLGICPVMPHPHLFQTLTNEFILYLLQQYNNKNMNMFLLHVLAGRVFSPEVSFTKMILQLLSIWDYVFGKDTMLFNNFLQQLCDDVVMTAA